MFVKFKDIKGEKYEFLCRLSQLLFKRAMLNKNVYGIPMYANHLLTCFYLHSLKYSELYVYLHHIFPSRTISITNSLIFSHGHRSFIIFCLRTPISFIPHVRVRCISTSFYSYVEEDSHMVLNGKRAFVYSHKPLVTLCSTSSISSHSIFFTQINLPLSLHSRHASGTPQSDIVTTHRGDRAYWPPLSIDMCNI